MPPSSFAPPARRRIRLALIALALTVLAGTVGMTLIEGWSPLDALYFTVVTLATVGYGDFSPQSTAGRLFAVGLIVVGVAGAAYAVGTLFEAFVEQRFFGELVRRRRTTYEIEHLRDHFIVCGYGRVGRHVVDALVKARRPLVVIEARPEGAAAARAAGQHVIEGDATQDAVLLKAGVQRARGVVTALDTDTANLFITLSCRALRDDLHIVSRVSEDEMEPKFLRAGANRVLCPYTLTGQWLANLVSAPQITDVLDMRTSADYPGLALEEVDVLPGSPLAGRTVGDAAIRADTGATIIALKRGDTLTPNPPPETTMQPGDCAIAFGSWEQLLRFQRFAGETPHSAQALAAPKRAATPQREPSP